MAKNRGSRSTESPRAMLHVAAVAVALLSYMLLPVVHAGHHILESRSAQHAAVDGGVAATNGCHHHHACRNGLSPEDQEPADNRHDPSSCDVCLALSAVRKSIELPPPGVVIMARADHFIVVAARPREAIATRPILTRTSRGPPLYA